MNKKIIVVGIAIVAVVVGGIGYQRMSARQEALPKIDALVNVSTQEKQEMVELYNKRMQMLRDWEKSAHAGSKKLSTPLTLSDRVRQGRTEWNLKTASDFESFDAFQNDVTNSLSNYLADESVRKYKPKDLERTEEAINRKRHEYHSNAFDANTLIEKYDSKRERVQSFRAEQELEKTGQWH